jgi:hypothetical protein
MLRPTICRTNCLDVKHRTGAQDQIFITVKTVAGLLIWSALSDERTGLSLTNAAGPRQRILRSESRGTDDHILLPHIREFPNLEGQILVFTSHRNRMAQLYPRALGSLFVDSYDSQGYGGGGSIRTRLNSLHSLGMDRTENTVPLLLCNFCLAMA